MAGSDPGDLVFDPLLGSGTSIGIRATFSAHRVRMRNQSRNCDVHLRRMSSLTGREPVLARRAIILNSSRTGAGDG